MSLRKLFLQNSWEILTFFACLSNPYCFDRCIQMWNRIKNYPIWIVWKNACFSLNISVWLYILSTRIRLINGWRVARVGRVSSPTFCLAEYNITFCVRATTRIIIFDGLIFQSVTVIESFSCNVKSVRQNKPHRWVSLAMK